MLLVQTRYYLIILRIFGLCNSFNRRYYRDIIYPTIENNENLNLNQRHVFDGDEEYEYFPDYTYDSKVVMLSSLSLGLLTHPLKTNFAKARPHLRTKPEI